MGKTFESYRAAVEAYGSDASALMDAVISGEVDRAWAAEYLSLPIFAGYSQIRMIQQAFQLHKDLTEWALSQRTGKDIIPDRPAPPVKSYPFPPRAVQHKVDYLAQLVKDGRVPCPECNGVKQHSPNCPDGPNRVGR